MSYKQIITLLIVSILQLNLMASDEHYEGLYMSANQAYKAGEYDSARALYTEILENGMVSSDLFFNLGNTYFKQGNIPESILYYERALKISPNDEDTRYNLEIANTYITDKIEPLEVVFLAKWWQSVSSSLSLTAWSVLFIVLLFISASLYTLFAISRNKKLKQLGLLGGTALFGLSVIVILLANSSYNLMNKDEAVVFAPSVNVKNEPGINATDQFVIHEGLKVIILAEDGDWTRIQLSDGNSGWLRSQSIERI